MEKNKIGLTQSDAVRGVSETCDQAVLLYCAGASERSNEEMRRLRKSYKKEIITIPNERIINRIFFIRGKKVMIDRDLAELYKVEARVLNQAVKRNTARFPSDFMFQLNKQEFDILRSQFVILKSGRGQHRKYFPYAFTEQGVAMLSSVLKSDRAIQMNIQIIRTFTQLRELLSTHKDLRERIENMEKKYDKQLREIFEAIKRLLTEEIKPKEPIGFREKK